jgi:hypothetical protein
MVDITITPANVVVSGTGQNRTSGTAGATILAGQAVYLDPTVKKFLLADSNSATVAARTPTGIALHGASLNQPLAVMTSGDITIGATLTVNTPYFLSDTPGGICPIADIGVGEFCCQVGLSKSTTVMTIMIKATGVSN